MREDIVAGLRNALEHGASLEQAVQSFINAGYNAIEVRQAAQTLSAGVTSIINPESRQISPQITPSLVTYSQQIQQPTSQFQQQIPRTSVQQNPYANVRRLNEIRQIPRRKNRHGVLIAILIVILLLLLGGLVFMIFYGQEFLNKILGS